jgi:hypothetical protein
MDRIHNEPPYTPSHESDFGQQRLDSIRSFLSEISFITEETGIPNPRNDDMMEELERLIGEADV